MTSLPPSIPTFSTWPNIQSGLLLWQLPVLPWVSLALLLPWAYAQAHIVSFSWKTSCHLLCLDSSNILFPDEHSHWRLWEIIPKHPNPFGDSFSAVPEHLILTTIFHVQQPLFLFFLFVIPCLLICRWTVSFLETEVRPYSSLCHSRNSIIPSGWMDRRMDRCMNSFWNSRSKVHHFSSLNNNCIRPSESPCTLWNILAVAIKKLKMVGVDP